MNRKLYGGIKDVLVPKMYTEYSTSKVLVMEWVEVWSQTFAIDKSFFWFASKSCICFLSQRNFIYLKHTIILCVLLSVWQGQKLNEVNDLYLVEVGVYCSFNQLLEYGFYHADPHPGNFLRTYDGQLAYLGIRWSWY